MARKTNEKNQLQEVEKSTSISLAENLEEQKAQQISKIKKEKNKQELKTEEKLEEEKLLEEEIKESVLGQEISETEKESIEKLGISEELVEEKLKQAFETQTPKKKKKSAIINFVLLAFNIVFMAFIISKLIKNLDGEGSFSNVILVQGDKLWWLAAGFGVYIFYILVQVIMYYVLIKDLTGKKRLGLAYNVAVLGKYYDNVTPFAVGGQPMQIVRLCKHGISPAVSTGIPIIKMVVNMAVNAIIAVVFFVFGLPNIAEQSMFNNLLLILLEVLGVIGLIITVLLTVFMFLVSSGTLITRSLISFVLRVGYKLKIVKNYRESYKKMLNQVAEYKVSFSYLWKNPKMLIKLLVLCIFECLSYASMPYFVTMAFIGETSLAPLMLLFVCVVKYYLCAMASCFIPLPGGTGLMEISFIFLFGLMVGNNVVWALLAWRILSYYMIIAHGFINEITYIFHNFIKSRKKREI